MQITISNIVYKIINIIDRISLILYQWILDEILNKCKTRTFITLFYEFKMNSYHFGIIQFLVLLKITVIDLMHCIYQYILFL